MDVADRGFGNQAGDGNSTMDQDRRFALTNPSQNTLEDGTPNHDRRQLGVLWLRVAGHLIDQIPRLGSGIKHRTEYIR